MDEREYIQCLAEEARDIVDLLSSPSKGEREGMVSAAFLRCLGVEFSPAELILSDNDPPDVGLRARGLSVRLA